MLQLNNTSFTLQDHTRNNNSNKNGKYNPPVPGSFATITTLKGDSIGSISDRFRVPAQILVIWPTAGASTLHQPRSSRPPTPSSASPLWALTSRVLRLPFYIFGGTNFLPPLRSRVVWSSIPFQFEVGSHDVFEPHVIFLGGFRPARPSICHQARYIDGYRFDLAR